jgi:hypothetical protein
MVLSRAKSGRTWLRAMLSRLYQQRYGLDEALLLELDNFHRREPAIPSIFFTHGHYLRERFEEASFLAAFGSRRLLFLVRHPCDVAVSEYFQSTRRASRPKRELHGVDDGASMADFVLRGPVGLPAIVDYLNAWGPIVARHEPSLLLRYEDVRARPAESLLRVVEFLGEPFAIDEVESAVAFADFDNLKSLERANFFQSSRLRPRDPDDPDSFKVRRGKVGGYADYFDAQQVAEMEAWVRERLDPVFGYRDAAPILAARGPRSDS